MAETEILGTDSLKHGSAGLMQTGRLRLVTLAKPKMSKTIWMTSYEPRFVWGNQEPIYPLSEFAMKATASQRTEQMAKSKTNWQLNYPEKCNRPQFRYSCGRSSVICKINSNAMKGQATERTEMLSRHKTLPSAYKDDRPGYPLGCGRSSPIWDISEGAKNAEERPHTSSLAKPKREHPGYASSRDVPWVVSSNAQKAEASARTEILARPKNRREGPYREAGYAVNKSTQRTAASSRVIELSKPRPLHDEFTRSRDIEWRPKRSVLRAFTSERVKGLSQPIMRDSMDHVQFNPDAFKVSSAAQNARISQRVSELAQPIERGMKVPSR